MTNKDSDSACGGATTVAPCEKAVSSRVKILAGAWFGMRRRAEMFEYPIREMQARQWIKGTNDTDEIESELLHFFGAPSIAAIKTMPFSQGPLASGTPQAE